MAGEELLPRARGHEQQLFFFGSGPIDQALQETPDAHSTDRGHTFQEAGRGSAVMLKSCGAPVEHLVGG